MRAIQTSSEFSISSGLVTFWICSDSTAGAFGAGHCHFGRASMARVGVMKLKVPPWRIGNLQVRMVKGLKVRCHVIPCFEVMACWWAHHSTFVFLSASHSWFFMGFSSRPFSGFLPQFENCWPCRHVVTVFMCSCIHVWYEGLHTTVLKGLTQIKINILIIQSQSVCWDPTLIFFQNV